jgi:hypothetical protein
VKRPVHRKQDSTEQAAEVLLVAKTEKAERALERDDCRGVNRVESKRPRVWSPFLP